MSVVYENAMLDDGCWPEPRELVIGIQFVRAELVSRQNSSTDEHGAVNTGGNIDRGLQPRGCNGGERFAGNAVILRIRNHVGEICEPAILHISLIKIVFDRLQLLSPVGVRVTEVLIGIGRTSPELVGVGEVNR